MPENHSLKGKTLLTAPRDSGKSAQVRGGRRGAASVQQAPAGKSLLVTLLRSEHPQFVQLYIGDLVLPPHFPGGLGKAATESRQLY